MPRSPLRVEVDRRAAAGGVDFWKASVRRRLDVEAQVLSKLQVARGNRERHHARARRLEMHNAAEAAGERLGRLGEHLACGVGQRAARLAAAGEQRLDAERRADRAAVGLRVAVRIELQAIDLHHADQSSTHRSPPFRGR
ncbi:MAG: hypothetical protein P8Y76_02270 [bacterium]